MRTRLPFTKWFVALCLFAALGCGDETSGSVGDDATVGEASFSLTGVAATSTALGGATVDAVCPEGVTGQAVTGPDGAFELTLSGAAVTCALRTMGDGQTIYAISLAGDSTAHVTPLTDMTFRRMVQLSGLEPVDSWFASPSEFALVESAIGDAVGKLQSDLATAGYTLPSMFNPHSNPAFVAEEGDPHFDLVRDIFSYLAADPVDYPGFVALFLANEPLPGPG